MHQPEAWLGEGNASRDPLKLQIGRGQLPFTTKVSPMRLHLQKNSASGSYMPHSLGLCMSLSETHSNIVSKQNVWKGVSSEQRNPQKHQKGRKLWRAITYNVAGHKTHSCQA